MSDARKALRIARALIAPLRGLVRGMISRAEIGTLDVSGKGQKLQAKGKQDDVDDDLELFEPYGFTSAPPAGSECLVLRPGGERAKSVALAAGDRSTRPQGDAGLAQGEVAVYHQNGILVALRNDQTVEIQTPQGASVVIDPAGKVAVTPAPGQVVELAGPGGLAVARETDPVAVAAGMATWMGQVATAINGLAPGSVSPPAPADFGTIAAGGIGATST